MTEILERYESEDGFVPVRSLRVSEEKLASFTNVMNTEPGRIGLALQAMREGYAFPIAEGVSTSDFPTLFGSLIDRELMAAYKAYVPNWRPYVKTGTVPDFNTHKLHKVSGQDSVLPLVAENAPYTEQASVTGSYDRKVNKHGRVFKISFEASVNDFMGAFNDIGQRFLTAVLCTEAQNATKAFVSSSGPSSSLYGAPIADVDGQNVTNKGTLALTIANLASTMSLVSSQTDVNGEPISAQVAHLVVPVALEMTARQILTSALVQQVDSAGAAKNTDPVYVPLPTQNVLPQMGIQLHVNRELSRIDTTGNKNGTWYVFADYNEGVAAQLDFLRGHETPEVCMKAPDKVSIGGAGLIGAGSGDFATDSIAYRVRCINGPCSADPRFTYAQVSA